MVDDATGLMNPEKALTEYFTLENHAASTRSADLYRATNKQTMETVGLWVLRHPLAHGSGAVSRFLSRMQAIEAVKLPQCPMKAYGVDSGGMAFAVLPQLDGGNILSGKIDTREAERRFSPCLRVLGILHSNDIVCGDLCQNSFWVDRSGDIWFIGVMGSFDSEAVATTMLPPLETLQFSSPEQRTGSGLEPASDVFAIGVLGYRLFSGKFPFGEGQASLVMSMDINSIPTISQVRPDAPRWTNDILLRCLSPAPEGRFGNAGEIEQAIVDCRQKVMEQNDLPVRMNRSITAGVPVTISGASVMPARQSEDEGPQAKSSLFRTKTLMMALGVFAVAILIAVVIKLMVGGKQEPTGPDLTGLRLGADDSTRESIDKISAQKTTLEEKSTEFDKLASSDDPLSHEILVKSAYEATSPAIRELAEKALIDRARRMNMLRTAEQLRQWLRGLPAGQPPPSYVPLLKAFNPSQPPETRDALLRESYATNPQTTLKIAAALALDSTQTENFQPVLSQLVGDALRLADAKTHSSLGLIMAHPTLSLIFGDDVVQRREEIPDPDLIWMLKVLVGRNDANVRAFANLAAERGVLPPMSARYLALVKDRSDLPAEIMNALVDAASSKLSSSDVQSLGQWKDLDSEKVLLGICASYPESAMQVEAFEMLAGRSLSIEPSASIVDWVRRNYWENRSDFARMVGVLANIDVVTPQEIDSAFSVMEKYSKDVKLMNFLVQSGSPEIVKLILTKYSKQMGIGLRLNLLGNRDPEIRQLAIKSLENINDIGALQIIVQAYDAERDENLKRLYCDSFWMIRERRKQCK